MCVMLKCPAEGAGAVCADSACVVDVCCCCRAKTLKG